MNVTKGHVIHIVLMMEAPSYSLMLVSTYRYKECHNSYVSLLNHDSNTFRYAVIFLPVDKLRTLFTLLATELIMAPSTENYITFNVLAVEDN
jgi:hypothetical protein